MVWSTLLMEHDNDALCFGANPDFFFDERYEEVAKALCHSCKLRNACLADAIQNKAYGVWGGTTEKERVDLQNDLIEINWTG